MPTRHEESRTHTLGDVVAAAYDLGSAVAPDPTVVPAFAARQVEDALVRGNHLDVAVALSGLARELPRPESAMTSRLDKRTTEALRHVLRDRKRSLLRRRRGALADEKQLLAEREPDWEDLAATQTAAGVLEDLSESERIAIIRVDAALERIAKGTYGACVVCHGPIDKRRLRAVPDAYRCGDCAGAGRD
jgi:RNA polymerase-binding transcription factor DksA